MEFTTVKDQVKVHATAGGVAVPMFALENELAGKAISDAYAAGDLVPVWVVQRGEQVYALLADGENASIGSLLMSAGNGTLKVRTGTNTIVAQALEALNLTASSVTAAARIVVMVW